MKYSNFEVEKMLESMTILCDTREQPTGRFERRVEGFGLPYLRKCLPYGDYSAQYIDLNGEIVSIENKIAIERKMNADEICTCFTKDRKRFAREFERAKADGAKVYLLIENESWERIINGKYRSKLSPKALKASLLAWAARYDLNIVYCKEETTGGLIRDILHYELKELLTSEDYD